jgi:group I intron endonuclease
LITIYKITNPKGKIYIGQTKDLVKRVADYRYLKCSAQTKLFRSLTKYGFPSHIIETVSTCTTVQEADQAESFFIKHFDCVNTGLNIALGGNRSPNTGKRLSADHIDKIRKSNLGKKRSPETCKKLSERTITWSPSRKGVVVSESTRQKQSLAKVGKPGPWTGRKRSQETIDKISKAKKGTMGPNKGKRPSEETRKKISRSLIGNIPWNKKIASQ